MKKTNYNKNKLLIFAMIIFMIVFLHFFYLLTTEKIWTYNSYSLIEAEDQIYQLLLKSKEVENIQGNKYFYYKTKKYLYTIENIEDIDDSKLVTIKVNKSLKSKKTVQIMVPNTKKTILKLIIESWRSN